MPDTRRRLTDIDEKDIDDVIRSATDDNIKVLAIVTKNMAVAIQMFSENLKIQSDRQERVEQKIAGELHALNGLLTAIKEKAAEDSKSLAVDQAKTHSKLFFWNRIGTIAGGVALSMAGVAFSQYTELRDNMISSKTELQDIKTDTKDLDERLIKVEHEVLKNEVAGLSNDMVILKKKKVIRASK